MVRKLITILLRSSFSSLLLGNILFFPVFYTTGIKTAGAEGEIIIQPGPEGIDTFVNELEPDNNFGNVNTVRFGGFGYGTVPAEGTMQCLYMKFDLSSIPPETVIETADLELYIMNINGWSGFDYGVYMVMGNWDESTISWNTQPQCESVPRLTFSGLDWQEYYGHWERINAFTELVREWVDYPSLNYGFVIKPVNQYYGNISIYSSDYTGDSSLLPKLVINGTETGISGTVTDEQSSLPVEGVLVRLYQDIYTINETRTDSLGQYSFNGLFTGKYELEYSGKNGYLPEELPSVSVTSGSVTKQDMVITPNEHAIGGNVSGIWDTAHNPYLVAGDLTVPYSETLDIQPGVEVRFCGHFGFNIYGTLNASGTGEHQILFTGNEPTDVWRGITFADSINEMNVLSNCIIEDGYATEIPGNVYRDDIGGGIYSRNSRLTVTNCMIRNNSASCGGGISVANLNNHEVVIAGNIISENTAYNANYVYNGGAGIMLGNCGDNTLVINNIIVGNTCAAANPSNYEGGGGIYIEAGAPKVINNVIHENTAIKGSGIHIIKNFTGCIENNIIQRNTGSIRGEQVSIQVDNLLDPLPVGLTISYNCLNDPDILILEHLSLDTSPYSAGIGNINVNPNFNDENGTFHLSVDSPCIDAGNPDAIYYEVEDLQNPGYALYPAMGTVKSDMGAYGGLWAVFPRDILRVTQGDVNDDDLFDVRDITGIARIVLSLDPEIFSADANLDGKVNVLDITKIVRIILGLDN